jgi:hypothetical protein
VGIGTAAGIVASNRDNRDTWEWLTIGDRRKSTVRKEGMIFSNSFGSRFVE